MQRPKTCRPTKPVAPVTSQIAIRYSTVVLRGRVETFVTTMRALRAVRNTASGKLAHTAVMAFGADRPLTRPAGHWDEHVPGPGMIGPRPVDMRRAKQSDYRCIERGRKMSRTRVRGDQEGRSATHAFVRPMLRD